MKHAPEDSHNHDEHWRERTRHVVEMMREMSLQTDPQEMVNAYGVRMRKILPTDRMVSLSRRDLRPPEYRITRSSLWTEPVNPWKQQEKLPLFGRGLLGELLYGDEPRIIDNIEIAPDDPAAEYFAGQQSLVALPLFDRGVATNMVVLMREAPTGFSRGQLPDLVWTAALFGRAATTLVLHQKLQDAYDAVDFELRQVADMQRSLLPPALPKVVNLDLAAHYETSHRAGGDYYDFFPLKDGRCGILIADVSGHGTPAAVIMAITHSIAHTQPDEPTPPSRMLDYLNRQLTCRYTAQRGSFVTAFYGIFDPRTRNLTYACAGHNAPLLKRCEDGTMTCLDGTLGLPLGIEESETYAEATYALRPGDQIIFYTDGITEARNPAGEMFGVERLDEVLADCRISAAPLIDAVLSTLADFTAGARADDDRTLLVAKVK